MKGVRRFCTQPPPAMYKGLLESTQFFEMAEHKNWSIAVERAQEAGRIIDSMSPDSLDSSLMLQFQAFVAFKANNHAVAVESLEKATNIALKLGDQKLAERSYSNLVYIMKRYDLEAAQSILNEEQVLSDDKRLRHLADCALISDDVEKAIETYIKAFEIGVDEFGINNMGQALLSEKKTVERRKEVIEYLDQREIPEDAGLLTANLVTNKGAVIISADPQEEELKEIGEFLVKGLKIYEEHDENKSWADLEDGFYGKHMALMGELLWKQKQTMMAEGLFNDAVSRSKDIEDAHRVYVLEAFAALMRTKPDRSSTVAQLEKQAEEIDLTGISKYPGLLCEGFVLPEF